MITPRRSEDRGHADHGWLRSDHTFSFAEYRDQAHMGFRVLRVLNQDRVQPGRGFDTHGHRDMEIVSYVLDGVLEHRDSMGNGSQVRPGEVQLMSAGSGVTHSEFNPSHDAVLHFLQMWVIPAARGTDPSYQQRAFAPEQRRGRLRLVVSPGGEEGALTIGQDARLRVGCFDAGESARFALEPGRDAWIHVARGSLSVSGVQLGPGDGAAIAGEREIVIEDGRDAEVLLWDLPGD